MLTSRYHYLWRPLLYTLLLHGFVTIVLAQEQGDTKVVKGDTDSCELNSLYLDYLAQDARKSSGRIFVIARLGRGEKSRKLNGTRLEAARFNLLINRELNKESVVFAEGERTDKEGRLEFYLGSKLYLVSLAKRGENVCFFCCNDRPSKRK